MAYGRVRFLKNPQDAAHTKNIKSVGPLGLKERLIIQSLFEQPVAFYAVTISIAINNFDPILIQCAWALFVLGSSFHCASNI